MNTLGLFVKQPLAGRVKTRLGNAIGFQRAADIYAAFLDDLIPRFAGAADRRFLCYAPATAVDDFQQRADGRYQLWRQPEGDLGGRLQAFFGEHLSGGDDRVVVIGSDSPTLPTEWIDAAYRQLDNADCVIGPATDGGYYLIGMRRRPWPIFDGIAWGGATVLAETVGRLESVGARLALLPVWYDVDTQFDLRLLRGHLRALRHAESALNLDAVSGIIESLPDDIFLADED